MTLGDLTQRLSRDDLLDGIGVYVAADCVALAHLRKRLWQVQLLDVAVRPLPPSTEPEGRRQAIVDAVGAFAQARRGAVQRASIVLPRRLAMMTRVALPAAARENLAQVLEYEIENLLPLPKDEVHWEWVAREQAGDRVEVLVTALRVSVSASLRPCARARRRAPSRRTASPGRATLDGRDR